MGEDILRNLKILVVSLEKLILEYMYLSDEHKEHLPEGIEDAIEDIVNVIKWSKNG